MSVMDPHGVMEDKKKKKHTKTIFIDTINVRNIEKRVLSRKSGLFIPGSLTDAFPINRIGNAVIASRLHAKVAGKANEKTHIIKPERQIDRASK